jgi:hypothetical protein
MEIRKIANVLLGLALVLGLLTACGSQSKLSGSWHYEGGDGGGREVIDLDLSSDDTYTKTLDAVVGSSQYGGTHEGTWTADGNLVHLSGGGKWPPFDHDLSSFQRR